MEKKILLGTLGGTIAGLIVAMALFMGVFGDMAEAWMRDFAACLKPMDPVWWLVGSVVYGLFMAILLHKFNVSTYKSGAFAGAWVSFFVALWYGIFNASTFTAYGWDWLPFDLAGNVVSGAAGGGVIGWIYGRLK